MKRTIVFGPPGTGKTGTLLRYLEQHLQAGVPGERIAFVSFSRRAIQVARERAKQYTDNPLPHFRTIHSTAYHLLGLSRGDVLQRHHLLEFGKSIGSVFRGMEPGQALWEGARGDVCMGLYQLSRARGTSLHAEWDALHLPDVPWQEVQRTAQQYVAFKRHYALLDFEDMVQQAMGQLDVDVLLVDEAQDTSHSQWKLLRRIAQHVPYIYLAGDDDQAVYEWSGAAPHQMLRFAGDRVVLPHSYRLARQVKQLADQIAGGIRARVPKTYAARAEEGAVHWVPSAEGLDLTQPGSWLLLARSHHQLGEFRQIAQQQGVVYNLPNGKWSWSLGAVQAAITYERLRRGHAVTRDAALGMCGFLPRTPEVPRKDLILWADLFGADTLQTPWFGVLRTMADADRAYVRSLRASGESLTKPGRVRIGTVHSVKGAEADHVALLTDVSERVTVGARHNPDAERRVQYVAVTRARQTLTLVQPTSPNCWEF